MFRLMPLLMEPLRKRWAAMSGRLRQAVAARDELTTQERYRLLFANATDYAIIFADSDGCITDWSAGAERLFGWTSSEAVGRFGGLIFTPEEQQRDIPQKEMNQAARMGSAADERWHIRKDGSRFYAAGFMTALRSRAAGGPLRGFAKILRDISDQRRAQEALFASEARFRFLSELGEATRDQTDPAQVMATVSRMLGQHLRASRCAYAEVEADDQQTLTVLHEYADRCLSSIGTRSLSQFGPRAVSELQAGRTLVIRDVDRELPGDEGGRAFSAIEVKATVSYPLVKAGRLTAVMAIQQNSPRDWTPEEIALVAEVGERSWAYIERARAYRALGASEAEQRRFAEERQRLYEAERAARGEAEQANRVKDEFLAIVSHELRTPLTSILGWANLLGRELRSTAHPESSSEFAEGLETIERNARSQAQLIDDLLDIARITSGILRLEMEPLDLAPVIESALAAVRVAADAKKITVDAELDPNVGIVRGDPARLQQIAWNLLSNAVKFTPAGGTIRVRWARSNELPSTAILSVADTGEGIDPELLPHVFDRFRQADSASTRRHGGLGLGLTIVRHLTEVHGGRVMVHSEGAGQGTTFSVQLPLEDAPPASESNATTSSSGHRRAGPQPCAPSLEGVDILVVEDEPDARRMIARALRHCGASVRAVSSAAEALAALDSAVPNALVSDISMPGEDGYELIRKIRLRPRQLGGQVPAVSLTAHASAEDRARALHAGFDAHVAKPVDPSALASAVATVLMEPGGRPSATDI